MYIQSYSVIMVIKIANISWPIMLVFEITTWSVHYDRTRWRNYCCDLKDLVSIASCVFNTYLDITNFYPSIQIHAKSTILGPLLIFISFSFTPRLIWNLNKLRILEASHIPESPFYPLFSTKVHQ